MKKFLYILPIIIVILTLGFNAKFDKMFESFDEFLADYPMYLDVTKRDKVENFKSDFQLVLLELDEKSYDTISEQYSKYDSLSAQKRSAFAKVVKYLSEQGVKAIAFDFTYETLSDPEADKEFIGSLKAAQEKGVKIILGSKMMFDEISSKPEFDTPAIKGFEYGLINNAPNKNNIIRKPFLFVKYKDEMRYTLALKLYMEINNIKEVKYDERYLYLNDDKKLPIQYAKGQGLELAYYNIYYTMRFGDSHIFPISAIIDDKQRKEYTEDNYFISYDLNNNERSVFKDAVVFIGTSSPDDQDFVTYSLSQFEQGTAIVPGVHIHMSSFFSMLFGLDYDQMRENTLFYLTVIITLIFSILFIFIGPLKGLLAMMFGVFFTNAISWLLFVEKGYLFLPRKPIVGIIIGFLIIESYKFFFESREKKKIKGAFSMYISPALVQNIVKNPDQLKLGGEEKELTILFSDIANFTTLSEAIGAVKLVSLLNEYLTAMTDIIMEESGTLDKYIGDAVMAFWGAPVDDEKHSEKACRAAIRMIETLEKLKQDWKERDYPEFGIRIGLNTGNAIVGNMGAKKRFNYTVMGDTVNLASRLEGLNKAYGSTIMVSESTYLQNKDKFKFRELDLVKVKGKTQGVRVFQLLHFEPDENYEKGVAIFTEALEIYRAGNFAAALSKFKAVYEFIPGDTVTDTFVKRCELLSQEPPEEWDGIWTMKTK